MTELNQWEYHVMTIGNFFKGVKDDELVAVLNQLGEEAWEVVGFRAIENTNQAQVILKRPLDRTARRWRTMP